MGDNPVGYLWEEDGIRFEYLHTNRKTGSELWVEASYRLETIITLNRPLLFVLL